MKKQIIFLVLLLFAALAMADQRVFNDRGGVTRVASDQERVYNTRSGATFHETLTAAAPARRSPMVIGP